MKVLAIGNSFSQDATRYLHQIAKADRYQLKVANLMIGGCSLSSHYKNMNNDARDYLFEFNGENTGLKVSIREALQSDEWDFVTMQQVSDLSSNYETFQPYLNALSDYVKKHAPKAKQLLQQTWAYEEGSARLCARLGYIRQEDMYQDVKAAYIKASKEINARIIPAGEAFQNLLRAGVQAIHRDTYHAGLGLGRYALALTWYEFLTGNLIKDNTFSEFDQPTPEHEIKIAKECAHKAVETQLEWE